MGKSTGSTIRARGQRTADRPPVRVGSQNRIKRTAGCPNGGDVGRTARQIDGVGNDQHRKGRHGLKPQIQATRRTPAHHPDGLDGSSGSSPKGRRLHVRPVIRGWAGWAGWARRVRCRGSAGGRGHPPAAVESHRRRSSPCPAPRASRAAPVRPGVAANEIPWWRAGLNSSRRRSSTPGSSNRGQ